MKIDMSISARLGRVIGERDELLETLQAALHERDEARACARVLAHAYTTDNRPPEAVVTTALAYPVVPQPKESPMIRKTDLEQRIDRLEKMIVNLQVIVSKHVTLDHEGRTDESADVQWKRLEEPFAQLRREEERDVR